MFLLDDILLAPLKGVIFIAEQINEVIEKEMSDEGSIKERLMALQLKFEMDEIGEEEYDKREDELLKTLERIRIRPHHFIKRKQGTPYFIFRIGYYRLILDVQNNKLIIFVVELGLRKNIYKK